MTSHANSEEKMILNLRIPSKSYALSRYTVSTAKGNPESIETDITKLNEVDPKIREDILMNHYKQSINRPSGYTSLDYNSGLTTNKFSAQRLPSSSIAEISCRQSANYQQDMRSPPTMKDAVGIPSQYSQYDLTISEAERMKSCQGDQPEVPIRILDRPLQSGYNSQEAYRNISDLSAKRSTSQRSSQYINSNLVSSDNGDKNPTLKKELEQLVQNSYQKKEIGTLPRFRAQTSADRISTNAGAPTTSLPQQIHIRNQETEMPESTIQNSFFSKEAPINFDKYLDQETFVSNHHSHLRHRSSSPNYQPEANMSMGSTSNFNDRTGQTHALTTIQNKTSAFKITTNNLQINARCSTICDEDITTRRDKSLGQNRKYCINKLFKKATGLNITEYKKTTEYRLPSHKVYKRAVSHLTSPQDVHQPRVNNEIRNSSALRTKSHGRQSMPEAVSRNSNQSSASRNEVVIDFPLQQRQNSKTSKVQRYKQIGREIEFQKEIQRERELVDQRRVREKEIEEHQRAMSRGYKQRRSRDRLARFEGDRSRRSQEDQVSTVKANDRRQEGQSLRLKSQNRGSVQRDSLDRSGSDNRNPYPVSYAHHQPSVALNQQLQRSKSPLQRSKQSLRNRSGQSTLGFNDRASYGGSRNHQPSIQEAPYINTISPNQQNNSRNSSQHRLNNYVSITNVEESLRQEDSQFQIQLRNCNNLNSNFTLYNKASSSSQVSGNEYKFGQGRNNEQSNHIDIQIQRPCEPEPANRSSYFGPQTDSLRINDISRSSGQNYNEQSVHYNSRESLRSSQDRLEEKYRQEERRQRERAERSRNQERSRSLPDTVPQKGPAVVRQPSPINNMQLRSNFGRQQQLSGSRETPPNFNNNGQAFHFPSMSNQQSKENLAAVNSYRVPNDMNVEQIARMHRVVPIYSMRISEPTTSNFGDITLANQNNFSCKESAGSKALNYSQLYEINENDMFSKANHFGPVTNLISKAMERPSRSYEYNPKAHMYPKYMQPLPPKHQIVQLDKDMYKAEQQPQLIEVQSHSTAGQSNRSYIQEQINPNVLQERPIHQNAVQSQADLSKNSHQSLNARMIINKPAFTEESRSKQKSKSGEERAAKRKRKEEKKSRSSMRKNDIEKLMSLQMEQARMLMDLLCQKSMQDESEFSESQVTSMHKHSSFNKSFKGRSKSAMSSSSKQQGTIDLIQQLYRQMDKINRYLGKRDHTEADKFKEFEGKMKKLQQKFIKVSHMNTKENSAKISTKQKKRVNDYLENHGESMTNHQKSLGLSSANLHQQSQTFTIKSEHEVHNQSRFQETTQNMTTQLDETGTQIIQNSSFENSLLVKRLANKLTEQAHPNFDFNQQFPSIHPTSAKSNDMRAEQVIQFQIDKSEPNLQSCVEDNGIPSQIYIEQHDLSKKKEVSSRNQLSNSSMVHIAKSQEVQKQPLLPAKNARPQQPNKLQTIQSVPLEQETSIPDTFENKGTQHQTSFISSKHLEEQREMARNMEKQIQQLNEAITELKDSHGQQINDLKTFYNDQIQQIKTEYSARAGMQQSFQSIAASSNTQEILQKLMNQDKFQETIQQLNRAVGQKENLESKLNKIKQKIKKAKEIRPTPLPSLISPSPGTLPQSYYNSMNTAQPASHNTNITSKSPTLADYTANASYYPDSLSIGGENAVMTKETFPVSQPENLKHQQTISQPSQPTQTMSNQVSYNILEPQGETHEEFQSKLNFQYFSKNNRPTLKSQTNLRSHTGQHTTSGSQSQQQIIPESFIQTFKPPKEEDEVRTSLYRNLVHEPSFKETSDSMQKIMESSRHRSIMSNEQMGINQKIINLQRMHQECQELNDIDESSKQISLKNYTSVNQKNSKHHLAPYSFSKPHGDPSEKNSSRGSVVVEEMKSPSHYRVPSQLDSFKQSSRIEHYNDENQANAQTQPQLPQEVEVFGQMESRHARHRTSETASHVISRSHHIRIQEQQSVTNHEQSQFTNVHPQELNNMKTLNSSPSANSPSTSHNQTQNLNFTSQYQHGSAFCEQNGESISNDIQTEHQNSFYQRLYLGQSNVSNGQCGPSEHTQSIQTYNHQVSLNKKFGEHHRSQQQPDTVERKNVPKVIQVQFR